MWVAEQDMEDTFKPAIGAEEATEQVFVRTDLPDLLRLIEDSGLRARLNTAQQVQLIVSFLPAPSSRAR